VAEDATLPEAKTQRAKRDGRKKGRQRRPEAEDAALPEAETQRVKRDGRKKERGIIMQNRFTSKVTWATIVSLILSMLVTTGILQPSQSIVINGVIVAVLDALVVFGILNNPTDPTSF